jgi:uncharacterized protein YbjT (DUF2867 family)
MPPLAKQDTHIKVSNDKTGKRILVLGGNGFIGRHIVKRLLVEQLKARTPEQRCDIIIGSRHQAKDGSAQRRLPLHEMTYISDWLKVLGGIDIVVNAVGILRERPGQTFEAVHHQAVRALTRACEHFGIKLIHISALGLNNPVQAPFSVTKKQGEQALMDSRTDWHIIRASLVEGEGAYGGTWFKRVAQWPVHFLPAKHATIAPVRVEVIAAKVQEIINRSTENIAADDRIHEVSNGIRYRLPEYLIALNGGQKRPQITIPDYCIRLITWVCDRCNLTPLTQGHRELLAFDNCPEQEPLTDYCNRGVSKTHLLREVVK